MTLPINHYLAISLDISFYWITYCSVDIFTNGQILVRLADSILSISVIYSREITATKYWLSFWDRKPPEKKQRPLQTTVKESFTAKDNGF